MFEKLKAPTSEKDIVKHWKYTDKVYISCVCITFNQDKYIKDAIDGFLSQETEYKFEIIIHDDLSTDKTRDILNEYKSKYPNLIKLVLQSENQYSKGRKVTPIACSYANGEYIALCEGDDFWINRNKLQRQCDFIINNEQYGLIFTNIHMLDQESNSLDECYFSAKEVSEISGLANFLVKKEFAAPCTWMMKREFAYYPDSDINDGSFACFFNVLRKSKAAYLNEVTAVYRVLPESASHSKSLKNMIAREYQVYHDQLILSSRYAPSLEKSIDENFLSSVGVFLFLDKQENLFKDIIKTKSISKISNKKILGLFLLSNLPCGSGIIRTLYYMKMKFRYFLKLL